LFETIGEEYRLEDDMLVCNLHSGEYKVIDQEFNIYFNGTTSPISTDILQFWLVCCHLEGYLSYDINLYISLIDEQVHTWLLLVETVFCIFTGSDGTLDITQL
jgi:hypothetical protein